MPCTHMICSVLGCKKDHNSSLFRVPSPRKSWDLYCAWVKATGNPKFRNFTTLMPEKVHICQKHFKDEEVNLMKIRRKTCVPTLQLPEPLQIQDNIDVEDSPNDSTSEISSNSVPTIDTVSVGEPLSEPRMDETSQITSCALSTRRTKHSSSVLHPESPQNQDNIDIEVSANDSTSNTSLSLAPTVDSNIALNLVPFIETVSMEKPLGEPEMDESSQMTSFLYSIDSVLLTRGTNQSSSELHKESLQIQDNIDVEVFANDSTKEISSNSASTIEAVTVGEPLSEPRKDKTSQMTSCGYSIDAALSTRRANQSSFELQTESLQNQDNIDVEVSATDSINNISLNLVPSIETLEKPLSDPTMDETSQMTSFLNSIDSVLSAGRANQNSSQLNTEPMQDNIDVEVSANNSNDEISLNLLPTIESLFMEKPSSELTIDETSQMSSFLYSIDSVLSTIRADQSSSVLHTESLQCQDNIDVEVSANHSTNEISFNSLPTVETVSTCKPSSEPMDKISQMTSCVCSINSVLSTRSADQSSSILDTESLQIQGNIDVDVANNSTNEISSNLIPTVETASMGEPLSEPKMDGTSQMTSCVYSIDSVLSTKTAGQSSSALHPESLQIQDNIDVEVSVNNSINDISLNSVPTVDTVSMGEPLSESKMDGTSQMTSCVSSIESVLSIRADQSSSVLHTESIQIQDNTDVEGSANDSTNEILSNSVPTVFMRKPSSESKTNETISQITSCVYSIDSVLSRIEGSTSSSDLTVFTIDMPRHMYTVLPTKKATNMVSVVVDDRDTLLCYHCFNFIQNSKFVSCRNCEKSFHSHCVSVKDNGLEILSESSNFAWFCDSCKFSLFVPKHDIIYIEAMGADTVKQVNDFIEQQGEKECMQLGKNILYTELEGESLSKKSKIEPVRKKIDQLGKLNTLQKSLKKAYDPKEVFFKNLCFTSHA